VQYESSGGNTGYGGLDKLELANVPIPASITRHENDGIAIV